MCINNQGSTKKACNIITRELWVWCIVRNNWITASHLPGVDNIEADKKSQCLGLETEWSLLAAEFCRVETRYGPFDIDLFASRINRKVQCYVSRYKDSEAWRTDTFSFSWSQLFAYIFPPFSIILRVLNKIEMDEADCVVIVPCWKTQVWFPKLVALMIDVPILLIGSKQVLQHPHHPHPHPILNKSRMIACHLSGKSCKQAAFQQALSASSSLHGGEEQGNNTLATSKNGYFFVVNGMKIPFQWTHTLS